MVWRVSSDCSRNVSRATSGADRVEQIRQQDEVAGALRQPHGLAVAHERHELAEDDLELVGLVSETTQARLQARHVAVVVGAPDVDEEVEPALELVAVVGEVGQQVRGLAIRTHDHLVLAIAELLGPNPDRAVGVVTPCRCHAARPAWLPPRRTRRACAR